MILQRVESFVVCLSFIYDNNYVPSKNLGQKFSLKCKERVLGTWWNMVSNLSYLWTRMEDQLVKLSPIKNGIR